MRAFALITWDENRGLRTKGGFETRPYDGLMGSIFVAIAHVGCRRHHQS